MMRAMKLILLLTSNDIEYSLSYKRRIEMKIVTLTLCLSSGIILSLADSNASSRQSELKRFPDGFLFGSATAAYQVEGAWEVGGKSESIWDHITHKESWRIYNADTGDIACDSYHNYKRDVEMLRELGVHFYRFSISWTRILPSGFSNYISEDGVTYYNNLINELLKYNIIPMVTIYHWDLPQNFQDLGGWTNALIVDWYTDYARVLFRLFGDRVQNWVTINEGFQICAWGYGDPNLAPFIDSQGVGNYLCAYNMLKAHASAYHLYDEEFRPTQGGRLGLTTDMAWAEPASASEEDIKAAQDYRDFFSGLYMHAVYHPDGDFPPHVKKQVAAKSAQQGFSRSRLPEFTPEEVEYIKGTADFFGTNHYSTRYIYRNESIIGRYDKPSLDDDMDCGTFTDPNWEMDAGTIVRRVPWGFRKSLNYIKDTFNNPPIWILENGYSSLGGIEDDTRVTYYRTYLNELLSAIHEDGVNVVGYTAWSLMDNFEWANGYKMRFGLYEVDFTDPARTRTPRKSAVVFKEIIRSGVVDMSYEPDSLDISLS